MTSENGPPLKIEKPMAVTRTRPEPMFREPPAYSQEADEGIQGQVILLVNVSTAGAPLDVVKVQKSLGWGLDEQAIACVRKWRLEPARDNGAAIPGVAWVIVDFSLPEKRPDQPTEGPIARPGPPPSIPETELAAPTETDFFYDLVAHQFRAPAVGGKIHPLVLGSGGGFSAPGPQVQTQQAECYLDLANALRDATLCEHARPVRSGGLEGSLFNRVMAEQ